MHDATFNIQFRWETYLILRALEGTIDIIIWPPYPGYAMLVVSEALLEVASQLAQNYSVSRLLVDLGSKTKPRPFAKGGQSMGVLIVSAVKAYTRGY